MMKTKRKWRELVVIKIKTSQSQKNVIGLL